MRRGVLVPVLVVAASWSTVGRAQPSATDKATADALFRAGKDLLDAGKAAEACPKLAESQRIDPRTGTLLNLASCHEQEGKTASAWAEFNEAASQAANTKQADREKFARGRIEELEKALSKLTVVVVSAPPGLEVKLDGKPLRAAVLGTPIPLDPGPHALDATAPARKPWTQSVTIAKGPIIQTVEVPVLQAEEAPAPAAAPVGEAPAPRADPWPAIGLALFGVGSATLGAGVFFGFRTFAKRDDAEALCTGDRCSQAGLDLYDDARGAATLSTITIGVGVVMMAAGAYFVLRPRSRPASTLAVGPGMVAGRW